MIGNVRALPGAFPLHEDRDFLSEREWVVLRLICHTQETLADADAAELTRASAGQISGERAAELVTTARIARLPGLGSWIARLVAEAGLSEAELRERPADEIVAAVNERAGYPICNPATARALENLQVRWRDDAGRA